MSGMKHGGGGTIAHNLSLSAVCGCVIAAGGANAAVATFPGTEQTVRAEGERAAGAIIIVNAAQEWEARIAPGGATIAAQGGEWSVTIGAACLRAPSDGPAPAPRGRVSDDGRRVRVDRGDLVEWFVNERRGIEHGFDVPSRPARDAHRPLEIEIPIVGDLSPHMAIGGERVLLLDAGGTARLSYSHIRAIDADGEPRPARMEAEGYVIRLIVDDSNARYPVTVDPWIAAEPFRLESLLRHTEAGSFDQLGAAVALDGETAVVGAPYRYGTDGRRSGAALIYMLESGAWHKQVELYPPQDSIGYAVAISGDTVVVGNAFHETPPVGRTGAAYVYRRSGSNWTLEATLIAADADARQTNFGFPVAVDGDTCIVAARSGFSPQANRPGAAYVFARVGDAWSQQAKLFAPDGRNDAYFGVSVALDGDTAVVGAPRT